MTRRKMAIKLMLLLLCSILVLTGCSLRMGWVETNLPGKWTASYWFFNQSISKRIGAQAGQTLTIDYDFEVEKGELTAKLLSPDGEVIVEFDEEQASLQVASGVEATADKIIVTAAKEGKYKLMVAGEKTKGSFSLKWQVK